MQKLTKEERVIKLIKQFIKIYEGDKKEAVCIFEQMVNPHFNNEKLSTLERTLIGESVRNYLGAEKIAW